MRNQRQVVDYGLRRRSLLAGLRAGRVSTKDVCDAGTYLLTAAKFHGEPSETICPVCRKEPLTLVSWVYGDELKHVAGSAKSSNELARMSQLFGEFNVHVVEVCRSCRWNHLVRSYVLGTGTARRPSKKTAGQ